MLEAIRARAARDGLAITGAFHPGPEDGAPSGAKTVLLLGYDGPDLWRVFQQSPEAGDSEPDPLDRWSRRIINTIATEFNAATAFPFDGPPWTPFLRWAYRAEPLHPSRLGMAIHKTRGLWSGWRGALIISDDIPVQPVARGPHPCDGCGMPCRVACPVSAFTSTGYDTARCRAHISSPAGEACRKRGCLARHACPVGSEYAQSEDQAAFHLDAFRIS